MSSINTLLSFSFIINKILTNNFIPASDSRFCANGQAVVSYERKFKENLLKLTFTQKFCIINGVLSIYTLLSLSDVINKHVINNFKDVGDW